MFESLFKKVDSKTGFFYEICRIFKNTFFLTSGGCFWIQTKLMSMFYTLRGVTCLRLIIFRCFGKSKVFYLKKISKSFTLKNQEHQTYADIYIVCERKCYQIPTQSYSKSRRVEDEKISLEQHFNVRERKKKSGCLKGVIAILDLQGLKTYIRNVAQAAVTSSKTNLSTKKHGKTGMLISNFQRFPACNFIKIETLVQVFSFEFFFKNIYFYKTSPAVASEV